MPHISIDIQGNLLHQSSNFIQRNLCQIETVCIHMEGFSFFNWNTCWYPYSKWPYLFHSDLRCIPRHKCIGNHLQGQYIHHHTDKDWVNIRLYLKGSIKNYNCKVSSRLTLWFINHWSEYTPSYSNTLPILLTRSVQPPSLRHGLGKHSLISDRRI